jgi:hypothetical protein
LRDDDGTSTKRGHPPPSTLPLHSPGPTPTLSRFACMPLHSIHVCTCDADLKARRPWHYLLCRVFRPVFSWTRVLCLLKAHQSFVAFAPRGNWGVDLQAGSDFGYKLFVVQLAGAFAVTLQVTFFVSIITLLGDPHPFVEGISMETWRGYRARSEVSSNMLF